MTIAVIAAEAALSSISKSFSNQSCVGITFEYYSDVNEILTSIENRGFYLDKLVLVTSLMSDWDENTKAVFTERLLDICKQLPTASEVYLVDSKQLFITEYSNIFNVYPQIIYQSQQLHVSELFGLVTGDIKTQEVENIDKSVKPKGFFEKLFGKSNTVANTNVQTNGTPNESNSEESQDESLFTDTPDEVQDINPDEPESNIIADNDLAGFDDAFSTTNNIDPKQENNYSNSPLFEDTEPESIPMPAAPQEPKAPQSKTNKPAVKPKAPQPAPTPQPKSVKSNYLEVFQKRTKILLFTGERRSGVSTVLSNMAQQAANDGLNVLVIDLDIEHRGQAVSFPFESNEDDTVLSYSLFRAVNAPGSIEDIAIRLDAGLSFLGTTLSVSDTSNIRKTVTNQGIQQVLSSALAFYDLIFVDCPFSDLKDYSSVVSMAHIIIHSMMTDYRSIVNTLNNITPDDFDSDSTYNLYLSKVMLLLNSFTEHTWNKKVVDERNITAIMSELTDEYFYQNIAVLGRVPYFKDYDNYINGELLVSSKNYAKIFVGLLNELASRG